MNTPNDLGIVELSLKHLKTALYVANCKNVTQAAKQLNRSQTAVTLAVAELEEQLAIPLFDRSPIGVTPTVFGHALVQRVAAAMNEFKTAGKEYRRHYKPNHPSRNISIFSMDISYKRLAALIALYETQDAATAAAALNITSAAIYASIRHLENLLDISLFERQPNKISATTYCTILVRHSKLAFAHIRHAIDELAKLNGITSGQIFIGSLPYTRTILIPRAINQLLEKHPLLSASTQEGTYAQLEVSLRSGDLDFIVGAIRSMDNKKGLLTERLFDDQLAVIARADHPLNKRKTVHPKELCELKWVLPAKTTPARKLFNEFLEKNNLQQPQDFVVSGSQSTVRGLLLESDRVALLSAHQIYYEKKHGLLTVLPIELSGTYRPIGVTMRANSNPSPAAQLFLEQLRLVANELKKSE